MSEQLDWPALIETALTAPGNLHGVYDRFYSYSFTNQMMLMMQGVREPVATYRRWQDLGRQVLKGSKAKAIVRPVFIDKKDENGEVTDTFKRFKVVRCLFGVSETQGEELPPIEIPTWNRERALGALAIRQVPFEHIDGNVGGYSYERNVAINPVAPYPTKTLFHEIAHVVAGHTGKEQHAEYVTHRGIKEFEAEGSAYLVMNELELMTEGQAEVSRGYLQHWVRNDRPPDSAIRRVFTTTDTILKAGREAPA